MIPRFSSRVLKITLTLLTALLLGACSADTSSPPALTPNPLPTSDSSWYTVYFTDPTRPSADSYRGGPDEAMAAAIDQARLSVDMAIYDFNLWSLRDAMINAHKRGVSVRMVTESDNMDEPEIQELKDAGIEVLGDRREGLMHDKFLVIDRSEVWTGSMNFTTGSGYLNDNNLIRIRSTKLAEDYTHEFELMFIDDRFSSNKPADTPNPQVTIDGTLIEVYFSPEDGTLEHLLAAVNAAQESIYFLAYSFTSDELAAAMIERAHAGVTIGGVFETDQYLSNIGTEFDNLKNAGIDVRQDGNPLLMHHKVIIIDGQIVITGSYNFSENAEHNNDENTLIIHNPDIAAQYLAEFQRVFDLAQR